MGGALLIGGLYLGNVGDVRGIRALSGRHALCSEEQAQAARVHGDELEMRLALVQRASTLLEKDAQGLEHWQTPYGRYWTPANDFGGLAGVLAEQAADLYRLPEVGVLPKDIVLDVGAHLGVFAQKALRDGAAKVVAIEPAPETVECLRRNLSAEIAEGRVVVVAKGAWDREDSLEFDYRPGASATARLESGRPGAPGRLKVPLTTIDNIVTELQLPRVDFIKMDIEGAEVQALPGARATLKRFRPRLAVCVYHQPAHPKLLPGLIREVVPDYQQAMACQFFPNSRPQVAFFW